MKASALNSHCNRFFRPWEEVFLLIIHSTDIMVFDKTCTFNNTWKYVHLCAAELHVCVLCAALPSSAAGDRTQVFPPVHQARATKAEKGSAARSQWAIWEAFRLFVCTIIVNEAWWLLPTFTRGVFVVWGGGFVCVCDFWFLKTCRKPVWCLFCPYLTPVLRTLL